MSKKEQEKEQEKDTFDFINDQMANSINAPRCRLLRSKSIDGTNYRAWRDLAVELELELAKQRAFVKVHIQLIKSMWNIINEYFL